MLELRVIQGPGRGRPLATHGESLVVQRTAEDVDHTRPRSGGWVVRPFVGGHRVLVNDKPANGRTSLRVGDRISVGDNVYEVHDATPPAATESAPTAPEGERLFALRYDRQALPAPARNTSKATLLTDRATAWLDGMKGSAKSLIKPGTASPSKNVVLPLPRPLAPSASDDEPDRELDSTGAATVDTDAPVRFPSTPRQKAIAALLIAGISLGVATIALVLTQSAPVTGTATAGEDAANATATTASPSRATPAGQTRVAPGSDSLGTSLFENDEPPVTRNTLAFAAGSQRTASDDPFAAGPEAQAPQPESRPGTQAPADVEDRSATRRSASRSPAASTTTPQPTPPAAIPTPADASKAGEDDASSHTAQDTLARSEREVPVEDAAADHETIHADAGPATPAAEPVDARTTYFLLDASGSMVDRLPQALDALRERLEGLDPNDRFLVVLFNGHGLSFVPALGVAPATERARSEALAFLRVDRIDAFGRGDRMEAILFAIAHAEARDKIVLMTDPSHFAGDPKSLYDRVARIMAGCDLRISTVQFYDGELDADLERIAEEFGGEHKAIHPQPVADAGGLDW